MCGDSSNDKNSDRQGSKNGLIRKKGRRGGERKETARAYFDSDYFM